MNRFVLKFVPFLILCLLLVSLPKINIVRASGTIYIKADGNVEGTDKIQRDGNFYTFTQNIYDEIVVERDNIVVDGSGYTLQGTGGLNSVGMRLTGRTNVTIRNIEIREFYYGIGLWTSSNNTISGNNITANNYCGICLYYESTYNNICGNNLTNNQNGIRLIGSSNHNRICENNITANDLDGITLSDSTYNSIFKNNIKANERGGIGLYFSSSINSIRRNDITDNQFGIELYDSSNHNGISENNIANNNRSIWLFKSSFTSIYHNNFVNNTKRAATLSSVLNVWDDGYPSGGNYWSNYNGTDSDIDGIGDTSYDIDVSNQDNYPLMGMFYDFTVTYQEEIYPVTIICNSTISGFQFANITEMIMNGEPASHTFNVIIFNVTGENDTPGFCRICIPTALMNDTYRVLVNRTETSYNLLPFSNSTHSYLYFTYDYSAQEVWIIPEFPSWISMLLIFILLTVAIATYKEDYPKYQSTKQSAS